MSTALDLGGWGVGEPGRGLEGAGDGLRDTLERCHSKLALEALEAPEYHEYYSSISTLSIQVLNSGLSPNIQPFENICAGLTGLQKRLLLGHSREYVMSWRVAPGLSGA